MIDRDEWRLALKTGLVFVETDESFYKLNTAEVRMNYRPRNETIAAILLAIRDAPDGKITGSELAEKVGLKSRGDALNRLQDLAGRRSDHNRYRERKWDYTPYIRGRGGVWKLTPEGREFLRDLAKKEEKL